MGTGYLGSMTGACLADLGSKVRYFDGDVEKRFNYLFAGRPLLEIELN